MAEPGLIQVLLPSYKIATHMVKKKAAPQNEFANIDLYIDIVNKLLEEEDQLIRSVSERDAWVIVDANNDLIYCVSANEQTGKADICMRATPYIFHSAKKAKRIAQEFKAKNGKGPIVWTVITVEQYANIKVPELEHQVDLMYMCINKLKGVL